MSPVESRGGDAELEQSEPPGSSTLREHGSTQECPAAKSKRSGWETSDVVHTEMLDTQGESGSEEPQSSSFMVGGNAPVPLVPDSDPASGTGAPHPLWSKGIPQAGPSSAWLTPRNPPHPTVPAKAAAEVGGLAASAPMLDSAAISRGGTELEGGGKAGDRVEAQDSLAELDKSQLAAEWKRAMTARLGRRGGGFRFLAHSDEARLEAQTLLVAARKQNEASLLEVAAGVEFRDVLFVSVGSSSTQAAAVAAATPSTGEELMWFPRPGGSPSMLGTSHLTSTDSQGGAATAVHELSRVIAEWLQASGKTTVVLHNSIGYLAPEGFTELLPVGPASHVDAKGGEGYHRVRELASAVASLAPSPGLGVYLWPRSKTFRTQIDNAWTSSFPGLVFDLGGGSGSVYLDGNLVPVAECTTMDTVPSGLWDQSRKAIKIQFKTNDIEKVVCRREMEEKADLLATTISTIASGCGSDGRKSELQQAEHATSPARNVETFQVVATGRMREYFYMSPTHHEDAEVLVAGGGGG